ncbi:MAG: WG repeat-containing protein [Dysgonamonadaceae bacterium]|jgi:hypothetical protein|nr:WG repeat-containing protein [Dysgonamonadaceae bacterium]
MKEIMLKKAGAAYGLWLVFALLLASCGGSGGSDLIPLYDGETYLYFNQKGEVAVRPEKNVKETSAFIEGLALVGVDTDDGIRYGFLNTKGKMAITPQYLHATTFNGGLAWAVEPNGAPKAINTHGKEVFSMPDAEYVMRFNEGVASFAKVVGDELLFGYVDKKGNVVIEPAYLAADPFSYGLAAVLEQTKEEWGYINHKGEMVIDAQFSSGGMFNKEGYAMVTTSTDLCGVIDKKGAFVVNPKYHDVVLDGDLFMVEENGKFSLIDKKGKILIQPEFSELLPFKGNSYTLASIDGYTYGIIDRKGKFTVNPQFQGGTSFFGKVALVISSQKFGLIDAQGKYVLNPNYKNYVANPLGFVMIASDYLDMGSIVSAIGANCRDGAFFGLSSSSTYGDAKRLYPKLSAGYYSSIYTSSDDVPVTNNTYLNSVALTFNGPTSTREYNYFDRKYETKELDPTIRTAEYEISFRDAKAQKKAGDITKAVDKELAGSFTDGDAKVSVRSSGNSIRITVNY